MAINVGELFVTLDLRDRQFTHALRQAVESLNRDGDTLERTASRLTTSVGSMLGDLSRYGIALVTAAARVSVLGAAASGAISGVTSLGAALAPLAGALLVLPGVAAVGAVALSTLSFALIGVKDAIAAALGDDLVKFGEALARLSPAAQSAAWELRALKPLIGAIRVTVQEALFAPLAGHLTALAAVLAGPLTSGMAAVADALGRAAARAAEFARSALAVSAVGTVFAATRSIIDSLSAAIVPLGSGLARLVALGALFAASLAPAVAQVAARFGEWLSAAVTSGRALGWMRGAVQVFVQLAAIARDVWGILGGIFTAMRGAGGDALGAIGIVLDRLNAWVNSPAGQGALTAVFVAMAQAARALGPVLAALGAGIGALAPLIGALAVQIGPILTDAINALVPALAALFPGLSAVFAALGQAVIALAPALVPLGHAISAVMIAISPLIPVVGQLAALLATVLADAVQQIVQQTGGDLVNALIQLAPHLGSLITSFAGLLPQIVPILPPLITLVRDLLPPLTALVEAVSRLLRGDFIGALDAAGRAILGFLSVVGNLGWELLNGLWHGIQSAELWFRDVIYNFFRSIMPDWVRQALGISSPSRVFMEIGRQTMLGMSTGMLGQSKRVLADARRIAHRLSGAFAPELGVDLGSTGQAAIGAGRGGSPVNIQVTTINPVAEPTSEVVNRGLAYAGLLGVL
ncbi:hypothetical protein [Spongiactinospora sp. TRM90649]|uniref:phage tail protein n=1 Tax=Spongiactinospora sp. TRM90649 TaxID=3031114 RepID=UPI0023F7DDFC|nr:hypothetical protein [Spongiactinospora sp. TRM90649]MDF5756664.1 hypothetical protein [Spongiactinospora sp. TRM90649]